MDQIETDTLLIGAGPIGIEMAVGLQTAGVDYEHVEARQVGHTISWFPRQVRFFSSPERIAICGVPLMTVDQSKATREDYMAYLHGVVRQFSLRIRTYERVVQIASRSSDDIPELPPEFSFRVWTERSEGKRSYLARRVIMAIGDMHFPRKLTLGDQQSVPGAELPHVIHRFEEPHPFVNQRLMIVGGRNSAVEAAIRCYRAGAQVSMSYRRSDFDRKSIKYWLLPEIEWLIKQGEIGFYPNTVPVRITPTHVSLAETDGGLPSSNARSPTAVHTDFVLLQIGYDMDSTLLSMAGVQLQGAARTPKLNLQTMETNVPGLYVAGTAAAGTQLHYKLFIENCHSHVVRILRSIAGSDPKHLNDLGFQRLDERPIIAET